MERNLFYRQVFQRENQIKAFFLNLLGIFSSWPRLNLEVFIRRNFGERYFNLGSVISVAVFLFLFPVIAHNVSSPLALIVGRPSYQDYEGFQSEQGFTNGFWYKYATWYLFAIAFIYFSRERWKEVCRNPSVFDFVRFSKYTGDIHPFFYSLPFLRNRPTVRQIEIYWEPALFLAIGVLLWLIGQSLGWLLVLGSILYSFGYARAYWIGDNFVMDRIDEIILSQEMKKNFTTNPEASEARGVRFRMHRPNSEELSEEFVESVFVNDDEIALAI